MTGVKHDQPRWKVTKLDWSTISQMDNTTLTAALRVLTSRQQSILLAFMEQLKWKTRWDNLTISQDELDALQAELSLAIMEGDNVCSEVEVCLETSPIILALIGSIQGLQDQLDDIENGGIDDNVYPPYPAAGSAEMCGSANYVITALRNWIVEMEDTPSSYPTIFDALFALLAGAFGIVYGVVNGLLESIYGGGYTSILPTFDEYEPDMIAYLNCVAADKDSFSAWVRANLSAEIADFIDCFAYSAWDRFVAIGSGDLTHACQTCGAWCVEAFGGQGQNTWQIVTYAPVTCMAFYAADEVQSCTSGGFVQFAVKLPILASNTVNEIGLSVRSTNTTGNEPVNVLVLDRNDNPVYSSSALIPVGSGLTTKFCFAPNIELPQGGSVLIYVHANSTNYAYANLSNVQVSGDGIAPYTPNCVTSYTCITSDPVITASCAGGGAGGGTPIFLGGVRWRVYVTLRPSVPDYSVVIKAGNDNVFSLQNITFGGSTPVAQAYENASHSCQIGTVPTGTAIYQATWAGFNPGSYVEFDWYPT